jgi:hypothetical protein
VSAARPRRVLIGEGLIHASQRLLALGHGGREDVLYWAGVELKDTWLVSTWITPQAHTSRGSFVTSAVANANVISYLSKHRLTLLVQVHTHPGHRVDHSLGDDTGAYMAFEGFLSIVVPHYGQRGILPFSQCGVHRYERGQFLRLHDPVVAQLMEVLPLGVDLRSRLGA